LEAKFLLEGDDIANGTVLDLAKGVRIHLPLGEGSPGRE
jgi:hypothetical protein